MNNYSKALHETLLEKDVIRYTFLDGREAIFDQDKIIASNTDVETNWIDADIKMTIKQKPEIIIFGSGHVSKALYDIATMQSIPVTVVDEREEVCSEERFPNAKRFTNMPYPELLKLTFSENRPYYVIMTHGHSYDNQCLRYTLRHNSSYIGMIGSKGKVKATFDDLRKDGFTDEELSRVHSPIGLKIGAVTPEEIAISIMAEIISVFRSDKNLVCLSSEYLKTLSTHKGVIARIIDKKGSAPRSIGSEMLVTKDNTYGTIGGGAVELAATEEAKAMLDSSIKSKVIEYNLSAKGDLKMICGGDIKVLFLKN